MDEVKERTVHQFGNNILPAMLTIVQVCTDANKLANIFVCQRSHDTALLQQLVESYVPLAFHLLHSYLPPNISQSIPYRRTRRCCLSKKTRVYMPKATLRDLGINAEQVARHNELT